MHPAIRALAAAAAILMTAPAEAGEMPRLGLAPVIGGGEYSTGGGITVALEMRNMTGRTGLCGVWADSAQLSVYVRRAAPRVLAKGSVALDGRVITHDLGFLKRTASADSYAGALAGCTRLKRPWQPGDGSGRLEIRIPRQQVHIGQNGGKKGGPRITFRDTGHPNPAMTAGSLLPAEWATPGATSRVDRSRERGHVDD